MVKQYSSGWALIGQTGEEVPNHRTSANELQGLCAKILHSPSVRIRKAAEFSFDPNTDEHFLSLSWT